MSEDDKEKPRDPNEGIGFVAGTVVVVYGALFIGGGILSLLEKRKGRGR